MKKLILIFTAASIFYSCNNESSTTSDVSKDSTSAESKEPASATVNYPYTIEHPDFWERGSTDNTMAALSALKAYESGNIDECLKYFGDSIHLQFDGLDTKVSHDSLKAMFTKNRSGIKNMEVKMDDWESVISKDKSAEYVSMWYKEIWENNNGKKDSLFQMDDVRMKNGKIVGLDEKSRKFPAKKS